MNRKYRSLYERLVANTRLERPDDPGSCWLWTGPTRRGYPAITMRVPGRQHPVLKAAHRLMIEEFHDVVFPFDEAGHLCYNTLCINPIHLEVQTKLFNLAERRGYKPPEGSMIPVLFPRNQWLEDLLEREGVATADAAMECPF